MDRASSRSATVSEPQTRSTRSSSAPVRHHPPRRDRDRDDPAGHRGPARRDLEGAEHLIDVDDEIDDRSLDIEEECSGSSRCRPRSRATSARWSPPSDHAELERSADLVVNICKAARRIYDAELDPQLRGLIEQMGEQAQPSSRSAIDAYVDTDAARRRARRHGRPARRAAASTSSRPSSRARRWPHRPPGRGAAGDDRPLLRTHRRPCGQHR